MRPPEFIPILVIGIALILGTISIIQTHYLIAAAFLVAAYAIGYTDHPTTPPGD